MTTHGHTLQHCCRMKDRLQPVKQIPGDAAVALTQPSKQLLISSSRPFACRVFAPRAIGALRLTWRMLDVWKLRSGRSIINQTSRLSVTNAPKYPKPIDISSIHATQPTRFRRRTSGHFTIHCCITICGGAWWLIGRVNSCRLEGRGFESRSSRHVGNLGKSFTRSCLWRFGVKLRHSIFAVSGAPLSSSSSILEDTLYK